MNTPKPKSEEFELSYRAALEKAAAEMDKISQTNARTGQTLTASNFATAKYIIEGMLLQRPRSRGRGIMKFPRHEASLHLTHNDHKSIYEQVEEWIAHNEHNPNDPGGPGWFGWVSPEQRAKAIETDSVWTLQWYPHTPVGFICIAAADLDVLLARAAEVEAED